MSICFLNKKKKMGNESEIQWMNKLTLVIPKIGMHKMVYKKCDTKNVVLQL